MNKYFSQPVLFIRFSGISFLKKISSLVFLLTILFSFNSASAQWINQGNPAGFTLNACYFINSNTGWASGNSIVKTTNGGTNWIDLGNPDGFFLRTVYFINENTGFVVAGLKFYKSTNGGTNWNLVSSSFANIGKFDFVNSLTGWAACAYDEIIKTTDGGNTWFDTYPEGGPHINFESLNFIDVNTGWACGLGGTIVKTTNGGTNWVTQTSGTSNTLYDISFSNANTGRAVGLNATFLRTTNGGANWIQVAGPYEDDYISLFFMNESTGWIGADDGIAFTSNNGTSWINQKPPIGNGFNGISFIAPSTLYTVEFRIWKSNTGGFNLTPPSNLSLTPVSSSQINLSWTDNSSEDKFLIERRAAFGSWELIDSVNQDVTSYQSTGLTSNTEYYYRVYAKGNIWTGGYSNEAAVFTFLQTPVNVYPLNNAILPADTTTFRWTAPGAIACTLQVATDTSFNNIVHQATPFGSDPTFAMIPSGILQQGTTYYWRVRSRNISTYSNYSTTWRFTYSNANYGSNNQTGNNRYYFANSTAAANPSPSKPAYNWRDTTGSINVILNGNPQMPISEGSIDDGRFNLMNILPAGNSMRFFGTNYQSIYLGTNGIIAFSSFSPTGAGNYSPSSSLPQGNILNAVFPFWKDLDFSDSDIPVNRLCYKVTSDELIITFMRAPIYNNTIQPADYVSFQIIIKHSVSPASNSKIEVMYNYDQTGSSFITKYNNNTLEANLIGLQAGNSSSQIFQYRYLNASQQLLTFGPMFGSNLALAMGPDQNTLPVELASFTSEINRNNVQLNWSTVSEENNSGFEIERLDAKQQTTNNWVKIGNIQGNGTTTETKNYSYEDRNVESGNYKYRLKQIDYNGNFEYHELSGEVIVGIPIKYALSQNYPNPFNPATKINFELPNQSKTILQVFDVTGKLVSELMNRKLNAGYYTVDFNASNLSSGIYFYRLAANDFVQTKKMLLIK